MKKDYLEAGRFTSTHGVKGDIKAECWCDDLDVLKCLKKVYLKTKEGYTPLKVTRCVPYKDLALMHIEGYESPEAGAPLKNRVFFAAREDLPLEEGSYFIADMIGLEVYDADNGRVYGKLQDVTDNAASQLYLVDVGQGKIVYLPAVPEFIVDIDLEKGIAVRPVKGLFDEI